MLNQRLSEITDPALKDLFEELGQVTGRNPVHHQAFAVFQFIRICQENPRTNNWQAIKAARFFRGSVLKTRVSKADAKVIELIQTLCDRFYVSLEQVENQTVYMALNQIMNPRSQLRKPPPISLF